MTKRILSLFLVCILAIPILAVPVSATDYNDQPHTWTNQDNEFVMSYLDLIYQRVWNIYKEMTSSTTGYIYLIKSYLAAMDNFMSDWNDNIFENFWAKMAAWLLVFWNGDEDLGVTGILPTINQGFSTVSGVLGTLDATVSKFQSNFVEWFQRYERYWLSPINSNVASIRSTFLTFVDSITERFDELLSYFRVDSKPSEDFKDKTDDITNGMETMPDVTYPDFEEIDTDFTGIYTGNSIQILTDFFYQFFSGNSLYLYYLMTLVFTFALMSFVLFGKR